MTGTLVNQTQMLLDGRSIESNGTVDADVCIVGGGPAGITLAMELVRTGAKIVLLESGGSNFKQSDQTLNSGTIAGQPYYPLDICRLRFLGGSSNYWGGWCRPLDAIDFEARDWVPYSGWPFQKKDLESYYERAQELCNLGPYRYSPEDWRILEQVKPFEDHAEVLNDTLFQIYPTRFGEHYHETLKRASNVNVILHANALEIVLDENQRTATHVQVASPSKNRFKVAARVVVLMSGGIENSRLLLASNRQWQCGLGNQNDLVGRFFADHLHVNFGRLALASKTVLRFYQPHLVRGVKVRGALSINEGFHRREQFLGFAITFHNNCDPHDVLSPNLSGVVFSAHQRFARLLKRGKRSEKLVQGIRTASLGLNQLRLRAINNSAANELTVGCRAEQVPNRDSRVLLDDSRDHFGVPRVRLDWRLTDQDLSNLKRAHSIVTGSLVMNGKGNAESATAHEELSSRIKGAAHHMGTTRMHRDPKLGVVDQDCRVHGIDNLYVGGSSVFPTGGWAPPTLTIVALSVKLAERLKQSL